MNASTSTDGPTAFALGAEYLIGQSIEKVRQRLLREKGDDITGEWRAQ